VASIGGAALLATLGVDILANDTSLLRSLENIAKRLATLGGLFNDFLKYDEWVQRTAATFDALGQSGEHVVGVIDGVAKGMANLGVNLNDARQSVAFVGREFGGSEERMRTFANLVTGLTARYNLSAEAARTAAQAYVEGNTGALEQVARSIPDMRRAMLRGFGGPGLFNVFRQGGEEGMGMQDRLANTLTATMTRLSNAFQLIRESFQRVFGPVAVFALETVGKAFERVADQADKFFQSADFRKDWQPALVEARLALEALQPVWNEITAAAGKAFDTLRDVLKTSPSRETQAGWDNFLVFLHGLPGEVEQFRDKALLALDQFGYDAEGKLESGFVKFLAWLQDYFTPQFMKSPFFKYMATINSVNAAILTGSLGAGGGGAAPPREPYHPDAALTKAINDRAEAMKGEGAAYREELARRRRQLQWHPPMALPDGAGTPAGPAHRPRRLRGRHGVVGPPRQRGL
jgi:hypothetical protein